MIRNFKALGLALMAMVALGSAVSASSAIGLTPKVQVGTGDGKIDGNQIVDVVTTFNGGRTFTCEVVSFSNNITQLTSTVEQISPTYEKCHSVLAGVTLTATITLNGCTYTIHVGDTTGVDQYAGTTDIVCPASKVIEIHVYKEGTPLNSHITANQLCGYTIGAQTGLGSLSFTNNTTSTPKDINMNLNLSKIKYTKTLGTIVNCGPASGEKTGVGTFTIRGTTTSGINTDVQIVEV